MAITSLRNLLSDNSTDKYAYRKKVFGDLNGTNLTFKTFEDKRVTDFTKDTQAQGVYKNNVQLATNAIASDNPQEGEFTLVSAPVDGDILQASYYYRWFLDSDLDSFLQNASLWLGYSTTYINLPDGLIPACLRYSAGEAYEKLYLRWSMRTNQTYLLEDSPDDNIKMIDSFQSMSKQFKDMAIEHRNDYYTRQGQAKAPLYGFALGRIRDIPPRG